MKKATFLTRNMRDLGLLALIAFLAALANARSGGLFLTAKNIGDILAETAILMVMTMGMMMVLITGGIDLSIASNMAMAGMVATTVLKYNQGMHPALVVLLAIGVGLAAGCVNGLLVAGLNILPIIATLGTMNVYRGVTYVLSGGSWVLQQDMGPAFLKVSTGRFLGLNYMVWMALAVVLLVGYFLNYARTGRQLYAVGNSVESAKVSGIPTRRVLILTYTLMGGCAGLGGILYVCKYAAAQGESALGYEMNAIASCVLGGVSVAGGVGKVQGAVLGAVLFGMLSNALPLMRISPFWQEALRGAVILFSILVNALIARRSNKKALERRAAA